MLWPDVLEDIPSSISRQYYDIVDVRNLYRKSGLIGRIIRKFLSKLGLSTISFCDNWIQDIDKYDKIIIHANIINRTIPHYLRERGYNGRIIYWYWNPVETTVNPNSVDKNSCEIWSFSRCDCEKYNLNYNSTYFFITDSNSYRIENKYDVFFIGKDKGRAEYLLNLKNIFEADKLKCNFIVVKDETSKLANSFYSTAINYNNVVMLTKQSKVILEILQDGQTGESLRTMESVFFQKKLITNNKCIIQEPYYNKDYIFVLGIDDIRTIHDFIVSPANIKDFNEYKSYFQFDNWLKRFDG